MRKIPLSKGKIALIDDHDFDTISAYKWFWDGHYANRSFGGRKNKHNIRMHTFLMGCPLSKKTIDHINGNPLDNRRSNLRICTLGENQANRKNTNKTSLYKGVHKDYHGRWVAHITIKRKMLHLGVFISRVDAAKAYDQAAKKYFGEYARLNFPVTIFEQSP